MNKCYYDPAGNIPFLLVLKLSSYVVGNCGPKYKINGQPGHNVASNLICITVCLKTTLMGFKIQRTLIIFIGVGHVGEIAENVHTVWLIA